MKCYVKTKNNHFVNFIFYFFQYLKVLLSFPIQRTFFLFISWCSECRINMNYVWIFMPCTGPTCHNCLTLSPFSSLSISCTCLLACTLVILPVYLNAPFFACSVLTACLLKREFPLLAISFHTIPLPCLLSCTPCHQLSL